MFSKFIGRRVTALATTLAVVVGLAITPAFAATAAEGEAPVVEPAPVVELVETPPAETTPPAEPPAPPVEPVETTPASPVEQPAPLTEPVEVPTDKAPSAERAPLVEEPPLVEPVETPPAKTIPPAVQPAPPAELVEAPSGDESTSPAPPMMTFSAPQQSSRMSILSAGITPASMPPLTVGQNFNIQFERANMPDKWSGAYILGELANVDVTPDGHFTGSFDYPGTYWLLVTALECKSIFGFEFCWPDETKTYKFDVKPEIFTTSLPGATVGEAYSKKLRATHNTTHYIDDEFTIVEGVLPPGLRLNKNSGTISGTVASIPSNPVTYNFAVRLTSDPRLSGSVHSAPQPLSITVRYPAPVVTTTTLPTATVGASYPATQLTASGDGDITWSVTGLPAGLQLDSATGIISGTPHYNPAFGSVILMPVTVTASNGLSSTPQSLSLTVLTPAPDFGSRVLPNATVGVPYDEQLPVTNGYGTLDYSHIGGMAIPAGLELTSGGRLHGTPEYNPSAGASMQVKFRAKVQGTAGFDRQAFTFYLLTPAPAITTTTLPDGWWKQPYNQPVTATGPGATVTVTGLPLGLVFDGTNITGKTLVTGEHTLTITAVNTAGEVTQDVTLAINDKPVLQRQSPVKVETGGVGFTWISYTGTGVSLALGPDAPAGMAMFGSIIFWSPSAPGNYAFTVTATNPAGTDTQKYTFRVFDAPVITQGDLDQGVINVPYSQQLQHDGTNVKFKVVRGELPDGLTLTKQGEIVGTPTEAGVFTFKVRAKNPVGSDSEWFNLTVLEPAMTVSASTIIRGNSLTVSGSGYLPGDTLELWLNSTPVLLGTVTATDGTFTSTVVIPRNTAPGSHHLVVKAALSGTQSVPLTVATPPAPPAAPQSSGPQLTGTTGDDTPATDDGGESEVEETDDSDAGSDGEENDEEELPTLDQPEAEEEAAADAPANLSGLLYAAFALLLAALILWFILWRRRRAMDS